MAKKIPVGRRGFLKGAAGAAAGAAALVGSGPVAKAQAPERAATPLPSAAMAAGSLVLLMRSKWTFPSGVV